MPVSDKFSPSKGVGQPMKYTTVQELEEWIDMYFLECKQNRNIERKLKDPKNTTDYETLVALKEYDHTEDAHPTVSGLALYLDMSRTSLINYEGKEEYVSTIERAKNKVESYLEQKTYSPCNNGVQFNLKNNFYWKDKSEVAHTGLTVNIESADAGVL